MTKRQRQREIPVSPLPRDIDRVSSRPPVRSTPDAEVIGRENAALMRRIVDGDEAALESLYDRYAGAVLAIARHILRHTSDAEEVVEDTFWEIWRKADRYDPSRGSVISYLLLLARSRAIDRSRQVRTRDESRAELEQAESAPIMTELDQPDADLLLSERREQLRRLLDELDPDQRIAIELNFFKGLSHQQVSKALEQPLGTVKTRIRQGLIQLYERIRSIEREEHGYELPRSNR